MATEPGHHGRMHLGGTLREAPPYTAMPFMETEDTQ